jgi:hypothetical protein
VCRLHLAVSQAGQNERVGVTRHGKRRHFRLVVAMKGQDMRPGILIVRKPVLRYYRHPRHLNSHDFVKQGPLARAAGEERNAHLFTVGKSWPVFDKSVNATYASPEGFFS